MGLRLELHAIFKELTEHVYNQPPTNVAIQYPCILYKRTAEEVQWADNRRFADKIRYEVTVIDPNPDGTLWQKVRELPLCKLERHFTADTLNHDVFNLFF